MSEQRVWLTRTAADIAVARVAAFREQVATEVRRHGSDDKAVQKALLDVVFGLTQLEVDLQVELGRPNTPTKQGRPRPVGEDTQAWRTGQAYMPRNRGPV